MVVRSSLLLPAGWPGFHTLIFKVVAGTISENRMAISGTMGVAVNDMGT